MLLIDFLSFTKLTALGWFLVGLSVIALGFVVVLNWVSSIPYVVYFGFVQYLFNRDLKEKI